MIKKNHTSTRINSTKIYTKGFTLFVALLVSSFVLSLGFSIGNIVIKQLRLSSAGGGSHIAFYSADSASECALFWDRKDKDGATKETSPFSPYADPGDLSGIICGNTIDVPNNRVYGLYKICDTDQCGPLANSATTTFFVDFSSFVSTTPFRSCAFVTISKSFNDVTQIEDTVIETRGYNSEMIFDSQTAKTGPYDQGVNCNLNRSKVVERGLIIKY